MLTPEWVVPGHVRAVQTLRDEAVPGPLPAEPSWLTQVHGHEVVRPQAGEQGLVGDAAVATRPGIVLAVQTADCLPVLFADMDGRVVAVAHAGWRGLAAGVLESTVDAMAVPPDRLVAWLGPAIGWDAFEIGPEVREALLVADPGAGAYFRSGRDDRWHAHLAGLARRRLAGLGLTAITGGHWCTASEPEKYCSYRCGDETARMATLVWMEALPRS